MERRKIAKVMNDCCSWDTCEICGEKADITIITEYSIIHNELNYCYKHVEELIRGLQYCLDNRR